MVGIVIPVALFAAASAHAGDASRVTVIKTPHGGIQPQAAIGRDGTIHLIYFRGDPYQGDLEYVTLGPKTTEFSRPIRVNSEPGTAIAAGTIRGGQIALGKHDRVHIAWNGSNRAQTKNQGHDGVPMLYTRLKDDHAAFEPERDLMTQTSALDGGGTVAADGAGNVCVVWHGRAPGAVEGEQGRRLWIARSHDDGKTFSAEAPALTTKTGACACCGTRALADRRGALYLMYRAATGGVERDMYLLTSKGGTAPFQGKSLAPWKVNICPMSSESLADAGPFVLAAWETRGEVAFVRIDPRDGSTSSPVSPPGPAREQKHPAVAGNEKGETLLAWTEGTGWQKGGSLAWQLFGPDGQPTAEKGRIRNGVPVWGLPTAVARSDGTFVIIH